MLASKTSNNDDKVDKIGQKFLVPLKTLKNCNKT